MGLKTKARARGTEASRGRRGNPAPASVKSKDPLYLQLARTLRHEIVSGVYPVGSQLPTEEDFCKRFSVSRHTIREALRQLREENLVTSRRRAGTTVVPPRSSDSYVHDVMSINDLLAFATGARVEIKSIKMVSIDDKLSARTGLAAGEEWLTVRGLGYREGADLPTCWAEYYIHRDFAAVGRLLQHHTGPIFPLIENLFGLRIMEVHQKIGATLVPPALASDLRVKAGTAAMSVRQSFNLADGKVAQVAISTHPAARFQHSMVLRRA